MRQLTYIAAPPAPQTSPPAVIISRCFEGYIKNSLVTKVAKEAVTRGKFSGLKVIYHSPHHNLLEYRSLTAFP